MTRRFPNAQIDGIPNLIVPAFSFMAASATKSLIFFLGAIGITILLNVTSIFQDDPYWEKRPRIVIASLVVPICICLFFVIDDIRTQTIPVLLTMLGYGFLVIYVEYWVCRD